MKVIKFSSGTGEYGELSNFWRHSHPLQVGGLYFTTSEHLYQSKKYIYPGASPLAVEYGKQIASASTPYKAKILANMKKGGGYTWRIALNSVIAQYEKRGVVMRPDWEQVKKEEMHNVLRTKFSQDKHCRSVLLSTQGFELVEHSPHDSFWGDGGDGSGQNQLGKLLVTLREEIVLLK